MSRRIRRALLGALLSLSATFGLVAGTAAPAHAEDATVYAVQLRWYIVLATQDNNDVDEVYIKVDGTTVWGPYDSHRNHWINLEVRTPVFYFDSVGAPMYIEMWDRDPGRNDKVGGFHVNTATWGPPLGDRTQRLSGNDGIYDLEYRVWRVN
ncbi:hypothetical protein [Yinghuangia soli]|uniref:Uncharacterized protein n=1 Tax=Yinghuangia soli TaxID=2908204 RepID=A0AA41Q6Z4_9ACTN|nr:hypothetical protein [Yinghuangia soli]MCF2532750.1 hypothetical protein [Yinghuangia soli]